MNKSTLQIQESQPNNLELFCVYMHTCIISGKSYIGQTVVGMPRRFGSHISEVKAGSDFHFHRALRLYGKEAFTSTILYVSLERDSKHLEDVEAQLIADYDTYHNGYNSTLSGGGFGSGKAHPNFGKKHTPEYKTALGIRMLGNQCALGKKHTPAQRLVKSKLARSRRTMSTNTSGIKGVVWDKARGKWSARIVLEDNEHKYLGRFANKNDAIIVRLIAELTFWNQIIDYDY